MFVITPEPEKQLIRAKLVGYWTFETAQEFASQMTSHIDQLLQRKPWFDLLVDLTEVKPVSQEVSEFNRRVMANQIAMGLRKSANIVTSTIIGIQLRRVAGDEKFQVFISEEEALAWLAA